MITTRNDLTLAKQTLDNLDQVNKALIILAGNNGTYTVTVAPGTILTFDAADLVTFLTSIRDKLVLNLSNSGVTSLG